MMDQAEVLRQLVNRNNVEKEKSKIITVTSGKGGVGKSNFIVNLAITLSKEEKKVLLFDADIGMGNDDVLSSSIIVMATLLSSVTLTFWIFLLRSMGLI